MLYVNIIIEAIRTEKRERDLQGDGISLSWMKKLGVLGYASRDSHIRNTKKDLKINIELALSVTTQSSILKRRW